MLYIKYIYNIYINMEIAVPLLALGGLYVASNQENKKEGL